MTTEIEMQRQIGSLMWINGMKVSALENEGVISDHIGLLVRAEDGSEFRVVIQANDKMGDENYDSI